MEPSTQPQTSIRILIADDHPIVLNGLSMLFKYEPGMEAVAEARNGIEAVELFRLHKPDITLLDLRMPQLCGVDTIKTIRQEFPEARIIVLTTYDGDEDIYRGLQAGAKGFLLKDASCDALVEAIRTVHAGQRYISYPCRRKTGRTIRKSPTERSRKRSIALHGKRHDQSGHWE
jgi:two-component system, NarL family, response regulator